MLAVVLFSGRYLILILTFPAIQRVVPGKDPEAICASPEYKELKWIAGEFYWMESVQSYNVDGWDYTTELQKFVRGGMTGTAFIDAVSGIVNRGCHNPVSSDNMRVCLSLLSNKRILIPLSHCSHAVRDKSTALGSVL